MTVQSQPGQYSEMAFALVDHGRRPCSPDTDRERDVERCDARVKARRYGARVNDHLEAGMHLRCQILLARSS